MPFTLEMTVSGPMSDPCKCPYHDREGVCRASISAMPTERHRQVHYCNSEDHDLCPIFLARELRTRPFHYCGTSSQERLQK